MIDKTRLMIELLKEFSHTEANKILNIIEKVEETTKNTEVIL